MASAASSSSILDAVREPAKDIIEGGTAWERLRGCGYSNSDGGSWGSDCDGGAGGGHSDGCGGVADGGYLGLLANGRDGGGGSSDNFHVVTSAGGDNDGRGSRSWGLRGVDRVVWGSREGGSRSWDCRCSGVGEWEWCAGRGSWDGDGRWGDGDS